MTAPDAGPQTGNHLDGLAMDLAREIETMLRPVRAHAHDVMAHSGRPSGWLNGNAGDAHMGDALAQAIRTYVDEAIAEALANDRLTKLNTEQRS